MLNQTTKRNPVVSCLLPILGLVVFLVACYGFCVIVFLVGNPNASLSAPTATPAGGEIFLWLFA